MDDLTTGGPAEGASEAWARRLVLALLATWVVSAGVALISFRLQWERWPPPWDAVFGLTLLAPLALPMSFAQTLGARNVWRGIGMLFLVMAYWGTLTALLVLAYRRRSTVALTLVFGISLIAAFRWLTLAGGILGV